MRVLGIDPGTRVTGWGLVRSAPAAWPGWRRESPRRAAIWSPGSPWSRRTSKELIQRWRPEAIAIERAFVGRSAASALRLGEARGALFAVAGRSGVAVADYAPATVKVAVAGSGSAEKDMVARGVAQLLGGTHVAGDATDALAVAICHLRHAAFASRLRPATDPVGRGRREWPTSRN